MGALRCRRRGPAPGNQGDVRRRRTELAGLQGPRPRAARSAAEQARVSAREWSPRFSQSLELAAGRKQLYLQQPTFYYPELPHIQFFDPAQFDWVAAVEAATAAIRDELVGMLEGDGVSAPMSRAARSVRLDATKALLDNKDWSALFLCENGWTDRRGVERCPRTWAGAAAAPLPRIAGLRADARCSRCSSAGARIAPHTGMLNTRLICHLPLIVPPGCRFRVGNEVREWEEGKLLIFDDTIEHEAWNDSGEDRVVLIFDIWRPGADRGGTARADGAACGVPPAPG